MLLQICLTSDPHMKEKHATQTQFLAFKHPETRWIETDSMQTRKGPANFTQATSSMLLNLKQYAKGMQVNKFHLKILPLHMIKQ